jgi:predicted porin
MIQSRFISAKAAVAFAIALIGTTGSANAADADLMKRIDALQEEIKALRSQVNAATKTANDASVAAGSNKASVISGADGLTIYGRLDVVAEDNNDGKVKRNVLQNISSRLGVKGERKINDDLSGIMQIETGVSPDDSGNSGALASRNSYVGLKSGSFGAVIAGKHDMPFKSLEGTASQLWGSAEAMEVIIHGKGTDVAQGAAWNNLHTRQTNVLQYWSPKFSNIGIRLAYSPDETKDTANPACTAPSRACPLYGASIEYNDGMWNIGLANEKQKNKTANGQDMTGVKATAGYKWNMGAVGLAFSSLDNDAGRKTSNWMVAGSYNMGPTVLKANFGKSSETASGANDGLKMIGIELDYPLDKFTTAYGYYTKIINSTNAKGRFEAGDNKYSPVAGDDPSALGIGIRYNF